MKEKENKADEEWKRKKKSIAEWKRKKKWPSKIEKKIKTFERWKRKKEGSRWMKEKEIKSLKIDWEGKKPLKRQGQRKKSTKN